MNLTLWDSKLKIQEFISMCNVKKGGGNFYHPFLFYHSFPRFTQEIEYGLMLQRCQNPLPFVER